MARSSRLALDDLTSRVSPGVRALNPHLFDASGKAGPVLRPMAGLGKPIAQHDTKPALQRPRSRKTKDGAPVVKRTDGRRRSSVPTSGRPVVSITSYRPGVLDDDNLRGGLKPLRDLIARHLGLDDADSCVEWRYYQVQVRTREEQGTAVMITR